MGHDLRIRLRDFDRLDFATGQVVPRPNAVEFGFGAEQLREALRRSDDALFIASLEEFAAPPGGCVLISGDATRVRYPPVVNDFTLAVGAVGNAGAFLQVSAGGGLYWWVRRGATRDQIGIWSSAGVGFTTNLAVGVGGQFSIWFGPAPTTLAGECFAIGVDVNITPVLTVSGSVFLSVPPGGYLMTPGASPVPPPGFTPALIGLGFGLGAGVSLLPADISVGPSITGLRPLTE